MDPESAGIRTEQDKREMIAMEQQRQALAPLALEPEDRQAVVKRESTDLVDIVKAHKVTDQASYEEAAEHGKHLGLMIKKAKAVLDPVCDATNKAHKAATGARKEVLDPLQEAKRGNSSRMGTWDHEQEQIRLKELRRIEEETKQQLQVTADSSVLEAVKAAEDRQDFEEAERIMDESTVVPTPQLPPAVVREKVKGTVKTVHYKSEVINVALLPREYMMPDVKKIGQHARTHKDNAMAGKPMHIPGTRVWPEHSTQTRSSR